MHRTQAFTLVEVLIVVAVIALLVSMLVPSLSAARQEARRLQCAAQLHSAHTALLAYAAASNRRLPPFAFSDYLGDLPLSGHWRGAGSAGGFARIGVQDVNLGSLVRMELLPVECLLCPAEAEGPIDDRFNSYCLRFPASEDLFIASPALAWRGGRLLGVYGFAGGGQRIRVGKQYQTVPQVRTDRTYRPTMDLPGARPFAPASGALLSDGFWADRAVDHQGRRNVCYGDGSVTSVDVSIPSEPLHGQGDRSLHYGDVAEGVWQSLEQGR